MNDPGAIKKAHEKIMSFASYYDNLAER